MAGEESLITSTDPEAAYQVASGTSKRPSHETSTTNAAIFYKRFWLKLVSRSLHVGAPAGSATEECETKQPATPPPQTTAAGGGGHGSEPQPTLGLAPNA